MTNDLPLRSATRARRAHRPAIGALLLALVAPAPGAAARAECLPAVQIEGDAALWQPIAAELRRRGIAHEPQEGCPLTAIQLKRRDGQIALSMLGEARRAQRLVADVPTAIAVIESWVRSDLSAPLLFAPPQQPAIAPAAAIAPLPAPPPRPPSVWIALQLAAGTDLGGTPWLGAGLRACGRIGWLCLGAAWQTLAGLVRADDLRRVETALWGTASLALRRGRLTFAPGLGLGVGWTRTAGAVVIPDDSGHGTSGSDDAVAGSFEASADSGGLRGELRLELAVALGRGFALSAAAATEALLTGRGPEVVAIPGSDPLQAVSLPPLSPLLLLGQLGLRWSPR